MSIRTATLLVVVFAALPLKADIILSYHLSAFNGPAGAPIPNNMPLGPEINTLTIAVGEVKYIQVAIEGTAPALGAQANWTGANSMFAYGIQMNYPASLISQPFIDPSSPLFDQNYHNAISQQPFGTFHPSLFLGYNNGATVLDGLSGPGLATTGGILAPRVLSTFKFVGTAIGNGQLTITDPQPLATAVNFILQDGTDLDPIIFNISHANYPLPFSVIPTPEPSSLALAGLTAATFGWRRLRRGNVAAKC